MIIPVKMARDAIRVEAPCRQDSHCPTLPSWQDVQPEAPVRRYVLYPRPERVVITAAGASYLEMYCKRHCYCPSDCQ